MASALISLNKKSQVWNFTGATCQDGSPLEVIPGIERFRMTLTVSRGARTNDVRKSATFGNCPADLVSSEFSYLDQNQQILGDRETQVGKIAGQSLIKANVKYDEMKACGYRGTSYLTYVLFELLGYNQWELKRDYSYKLDNHTLQLKYWEPRCRFDTLTLHFEAVP
jgi:hypothetical protein